jgi:hypothetical protein
MYAGIDPRTMATSVVGTVQRINRASLVEIYDLIPLLRSRSATTGEIDSATGGRYVSLAQQNVSHFSNVGGGRNNIDTWGDGHRAALALAAAGNANAAWAMSAAADHSLTDAFAAGHLRPQRADLVQSASGQIWSKELHDLDNEHGVAVHNLRGDRWIPYGDDHLNDAENELRIARKAFEASAPDLQTGLFRAVRVRAAAGRGHDSTSGVRGVGGSAHRPGGGRGSVTDCSIRGGRRRAICRSRSRWPRSPLSPESR